MKNEEKIVFAITDDKSTVLLGLSEASWNHMKDGKTHTLDLNLIGIPIKIMLYGGKDRAAVLAPLKTDENTLDLRGLDMGFGSPE